MQIDIEDTLIRDIQAYMASKGITTDVGKYINALLLEGFSIKKYEQFVYLKGRTKPDTTQMANVATVIAAERAGGIDKLKEMTNEEAVALVQDIINPTVQETKPEQVEEAPKPAPRRRTGVKITKK